MNGERLKRIMKANGLTNNDVAARGFCLVTPFLSLT